MTSTTTTPVLAEEHGVIDGCLTLCILKTDRGYVVGAHVPGMAEVFNPLQGQRMASADAYERLSAGRFVEKFGVDGKAD